MRIFVHEFVTGGGWHSVSKQLPPDSLLAEGRAMLSALTADLVALDGVSVVTLCDGRMPPVELLGITAHRITSVEAERQAIDKFAQQADATILIAPEFDGHLLDRVRRVERVAGRLLSPSSQVVALASDKHATAQHLQRRGVNVPRGIAIEPGEALPPDFGYPAVLKPRDGAGSLGIQWIGHRPLEDVPVETPARLEAYYPGIAASVAVLCGPGQRFALEPCAQTLAGSGDFSYLGGSLPLDPALASRARRLALRAVETLPEPVGYLGVDLVLGADPVGSGDVVIEINPRFTTSYVGLRAHSLVNLAGAMIAVAQGRVAELCWNTETIQFSSSGVRGLPPAAD